jgi:hypothetical protein
MATVLSMATVQAPLPNELRAWWSLGSVSVAQMTRLPPAFFMAARS